jgi:hypothetical protein
MKNNVLLLSYLAQFLLEWKVFQKKKLVVKNQNTFYVQLFFKKIVPFMR